MEALQKELQKIAERAMNAPNLNTAQRSNNTGQRNYFALSGDDVNSAYGLNCERCKNTGYVYFQSPNSHIPTAVRCSCSRRRQSLKHLKESGLDKAVEELTFDSFTVTTDFQRSLKQKAADYLNSADAWFFIGGQSGSGKTHICTAICGKLLFEKNKSLFYSQWVKDVKRLKAIVPDNSERDKLLSRLKNVDVLYLDDFFKQGRLPSGVVPPPSSAEIGLAFEILNFRYVNRLPSIISTERSLEDIIDIDEAIGSRIFERCNNGEFVLNIRQDQSKNYRLSKSN